MKITIADKQKSVVSEQILEGFTTCSWLTSQIRVGMWSFQLVIHAQYFLSPSDDQREGLAKIDLIPALAARPDEHKKVIETWQEIAEARSILTLVAASDYMPGSASGRVPLIAPQQHSCRLKPLHLWNLPIENGHKFVDDEWARQKAAFTVDLAVERLTHASRETLLMAGFRLSRVYV